MTEWFDLWSLSVIFLSLRASFNQRSDNFSVMNARRVRIIRFCAHSASFKSSEKLIFDLLQNSSTVAGNRTASARTRKTAELVSNLFTWIRCSSIFSGLRAQNHLISDDSETRIRPLPICAHVATRNGVWMEKMCHDESSGLNHCIYLWIATDVKVKMKQEFKDNNFVRSGVRHTRHTELQLRLQCEGMQDVKRWDHWQDCEVMFPYAHSNRWVITRNQQAASSSWILFFSSQSLVFCHIKLR